LPESYTNTKLGVRRRIGEAVALYRFHADPEEQVRDLLASMNANLASIELLLGEPLRDKTMLEIGPGQLMKNARFFGSQNRVVAIDLDKVVTEWNVGEWWEMLRKNGPLRFSKTLARKALGTDRRFLRELARQMPATANARIEFLQRDAAHTGLDDESFDCAVSFSVLEHLPEPSLIMREIARLLRPGGVAFHIIHCYTCDSGAHDARSFMVERSNLPYWAHLRPETSQLVSSNSYVNKLSIREWKKLLYEDLPGVQIQSVMQDDVPRLAHELQALRAAGELGDYSDEELMTNCLQVAWVKPAVSPAVPAGTSEG
jgi:2-polyprenyl-3-methyl-5-hydroxy-6-metoxy-1,4-benzoquinol methylase